MSFPSNLTRKLSLCVDAATDVRENKAIWDAELDSLIIAAALLDNASGHEDDSGALSESAIECVRELRAAVWELIETPWGEIDVPVLQEAATRFDQRFPAEIDLGERVRTGR